MRRLDEPRRDYQRYRHDPNEKMFLANNGLQHVLSSNVSAFGVDGDDLIVRFHNGSLYQYTGVGDLYSSALTSNSKGKWVWRNLRRKPVMYRKIGVLPLPDDLGLTDEEIFKQFDDRYVRDLTRAISGVPLTREFVLRMGQTFEKIQVGNITVYKPATGVVLEETKVTQGVKMLGSFRDDIKDIYDMTSQQEINVIEKIVKKQGFDGLPKKVNKTQFDNLVSKNKIIAYRGYSSDDKDALDAYRKELENGQFYVAAHGGDAMGRGFYTASNVDDINVSDPKDEAVMYGQVSNKKYYAIDTYTFDESYKEIELSKLHDEYFDNYYREYLSKRNNEKMDEYHRLQQQFFMGTPEQRDDAISKIKMFDDKDIASEYHDIKDEVFELDEGIKAAELGYDGIVAKRGKNLNYRVVLNRSKLVILDTVEVFDNTVTKVEEDDMF